MNANVEIVDNRIVLTLPPEAAARLNLTGSGEVGVEASPNGFALVSDLEIANQLEIARGVMQDDHDALSELAK